jgi:hypothetical protein
MDLPFLALQIVAANCIKIRCMSDYRFDSTPPARQCFQAMVDGMVCCDVSWQVLVNPTMFCVILPNIYTRLLCKNRSRLLVSNTQCHSTAYRRGTVMQGSGLRIAAMMVKSGGPCCNRACDDGRESAWTKVIFPNALQHETTDAAGV